MTTTKARGARRILTITHADNTVSKRTTTADYAYGVECSPIDRARRARHLEMLAIEAECHAENVEDLLVNGFKTLRRDRGWGDKGAYSDFTIEVQTMNRGVPNIGLTVYAHCNYNRESKVTEVTERDANGHTTGLTEKPVLAVDVLRDRLERLLAAKRERVTWLREQAVGEPTDDQLAYSVIRWSKTQEAAGKAAQGAEFAHLRAAGHTLTVVKVDQAHEGHEPGVYISPAARQNTCREAYINAVNATAIHVPATPDEPTVGETPAAIDVPDEADFILCTTTLGGGVVHTGTELADGDVFPTCRSGGQDSRGTQYRRVTGEELTCATCRMYRNRRAEARERASVTIDGLYYAVLGWNAAHGTAPAVWQFDRDKGFASRLVGHLAAVIEINDDRSAYTVAIVNVITASTVITERVESAVIEAADRMLRQAVAS